MKWLIRHREPPGDKSDVKGAQESLDEAHRRWPLVHEAAAALRHERELNHFAENIRKTMRKHA